MTDIWEICYNCGILYGNRPPKENTETKHQGVCEICGFAQPVSHPREYGFLKEDWNVAYYEDCKKGKYYGRFY